MNTNKKSTLKPSLTDFSTKANLIEMILQKTCPFQRMVNATIADLDEARSILKDILENYEMSEKEQEHALYLSGCYSRICSLYRLFAANYKTIQTFEGLRVWSELCSVVRKFDINDTSIVYLLVMNKPKKLKPIEIQDGKSYDIIMGWGFCIARSEEEQTNVENNLLFKQEKIVMNDSSQALGDLLTRLMKVGAKNPNIQVVGMTDITFLNCTNLITRLTNVSDPVAATVVKAFLGNKCEETIISQDQRNLINELFVNMDYSIVEIQQLNLNLGWNTPKVNQEELGEPVDLSFCSKSLNKEKENRVENETQTTEITESEIYTKAYQALEVFAEEHFWVNTDALEEISALYTDILALPSLNAITGDYAKLVQKYEQPLLALGAKYSGRMTAAEYVNKVTAKVNDVKEGKCEGPNLMDQIQTLINVRRLRLIPTVDQWLHNGITDYQLQELLSPDSDLGTLMLVVERAHLLGKPLVRVGHDQHCVTVIATIDNRILDRPFFGWYDDRHSDLRPDVTQLHAEGPYAKAVVCKAMPDEQLPLSPTDVRQPAVQPGCCGTCHKSVKVRGFQIDLNEQDKNPLKSVQLISEGFTKPQVFGGHSIPKDTFIKIGKEIIQDLSTLPLPVLPHCYSVESAIEVLTNFANTNNSTIGKLAEILSALYINAPVSLSVEAIKGHYLENNGTPKQLEGIDRMHAEKLLTYIFTNKFGRTIW